MIFKPKTKPYAHQAETFEKTRDLYYHAIFAEQGLGKTKMSIDTADYLYQMVKIRKVMILAPNGVHANWILREVPFHSHVPQCRMYWDGMNTKREDRQFRAFIHSDGLLWYSMNIEALRTERGWKLACDFVDGETLLIVDESTMIKNPKAQQTKNAVNLGLRAMYRRILSGTPIVQNPLDIWSQALFLSPSALPYQSWTAFKAKYAIEVVQHMQNRSFRKVVGFRHMEHLRELVGRFSTRLLKSDCLDLPPKIYSTREVPFDPKQKRAYEQMREIQVAQLEEKAKTTTITAQTVLTALIKLQQILCGFAIDEAGNCIDVPTLRYQALKDIIEDTDGKVIIWTHFKHSVERIGEYLRKTFPESDTGLYYGGTKNDDRNRIVDSFQEESNKMRFIVANSAASKGLTLTRGQTNIYFTNTFNLETRLQSEDRTHRIGTSGAVNYIDLVTHNTVDEKIIKALRHKVSLGDMVIRNDWQELFRNPPQQELFER